MKIGILGSGNIGRTLVKRLSAAGHDVKVANSRGPDTIEAHTLQSGARAVTAQEAVRDVEVVILSVPLHRIPDIAPVVRTVPESAVIIDTSNYYPARDNRIDAIETGTAESVWVAQQLGRPVVKAWNAIDSDSFARNDKAAGSPGRTAIPVAADDQRDRAAAMTLVEQTGFDAYDAGVLADSWRQQPGSPCYCTNLDLKETAAALLAADASRSPRRRDLALAVVQEKVGDISVQNADASFLVRLNRLLFL